MKKRLVALSIIFSMLVATLLGCGIITTNYQRDMDQVVAAVGYSDPGAEGYVQRERKWVEDDSELGGYYEYVDGKKKILKRELVNVFVNVGSSYMSNYNWTAQETVQNLLDMLINREIMVQEAIRAVYLDKTGNSAGGTLEACFEEDEIREAEITVYNQYYKTIKDIKNEIDKEQGKVTPSPSPTASATATPTPRPTQAPVASPSPSPEEVEPDIPDEENWNAAVKRYERQLKGNDENLTVGKYRAMMLNSELENKLIEKYQKLIEDQTIEEKTAEKDLFTLVEERYEELLYDQKTQYENDKAGFVTALQDYDGSSFMLYNPVDGYFYVKSILIGFNDTQSNQIKENEGKGWTQEKLKAEREKILAQVIAEDLRDIVRYIPDEDEEDGERMEVVEFPAWLPYEGKKELNADNEVEDNEKREGYVPHSLRSDNSRTAFLGVLQDKMKELAANDAYLASETYNPGKTPFENAFASLIFKYGTDPGMFNNAVDYLVGQKPSPGTTEKFVTEFADGARAAQTDYLNKLAEPGATQSDAQLASIRIVATEYGWHVIMVTNEVNFTATNKPVKGDLEKVGTFTYKLAEAVKNEWIQNAYNEASTVIQMKYKDTAGFVDTYEKAYKDLLKLK